jgi:hypothetical protein
VIWWRSKEPKNLAEVSCRESYAGAQNSASLFSMANLYEKVEANLDQATASSGR